PVRSFDHGSIYTSEQRSIIRIERPRGFNRRSRLGNKPSSVAGIMPCTASNDKPALNLPTHSIGPVVSSPRCRTSPALQIRGRRPAAAIFQLVHGAISFSGGEIPHQRPRFRFGKVRPQGLFDLDEVLKRIYDPFVPARIELVDVAPVNRAPA